MNKNMSVSDIIKDEYKSWEPGSVQLIATQTGSQKTTFVLTTLLENAAKKGKYLIYICNRRTLNRQIKSRMFEKLNISEDHKKYLRIFTYQHFETTGSFPDFSVPQLKGLSKSEKFLRSFFGITSSEKIKKSDVYYYVFDEAHYILSDSMVNSRTCYWTPEKLRQSPCISVLLTSTPEALCLYLDFPTWNVKYIISDVTDKYLERHNYSIRQHLPSNMDEFLYKFNQAQKFMANSPCLSVFHTTNEERLYERWKDFSFTYFKEREIKEENKTFAHPYELFFKWMDYILENIQKNSEFFNCSNKIYKDSPTYDYVNCFYFEIYEDLYERVIASNNKWIIFVDSEKEGFVLESYFRSKGQTAVFLCAQRKNDILSGAKDAFEEIETQNIFSSKILISTSVLDNGTSIAAEDGTNLVIAQTDKTEFIQMLGRCRVTPGTKINLFIKNYSAQKINSLRAKYENVLRFMIHFYTEQTAADLSPNTLNLSKKVIEENAGAFLRSKTRNDENTISGFFEDYRINDAVFVHCLYSLKILVEALEDSDDPAFYLKRQLHWIGKGYSPEKWVNYAESKLALQNLLEEYQKKKRLHKDEQDEFCRKMIEVIRLFPKPLLSQSMRSFWKRYLSKKNCGEELLPGKVLLNKFFDQQNQPYIIISKQWYKDHKTVWVIQRKEGAVKKVS